MTNWGRGSGYPPGFPGRLAELPMREEVRVNAREYEGTCPLCSADAKYRLVDYENRKYVKCIQCGLFQISLRAEGVLQKGPQEWRDAYAQMSKRAPVDKRLVILVPSAAPGEVQAAVSADYNSADDLPG
jgi:Zn ribbon nucleic-acid-binding protein